MEVATSHRNQNSTGPHAVGAASLIVGGMVPIDGQRGLVKQQGGLFPLCKKIIGFVAEMCQASYNSIAKTTCRSPSGRLPAVAEFQGRGGRVPPHPDTSPSRQPQPPCYPLPMQPANKALDQHTPAPWRSSPAWPASATTCGSAPDSRRLFLTGEKMAQRFCRWGRIRQLRPLNRKQPPGAPAPTPAATASSKDMRRPRWG